MAMATVAIRILPTMTAMTVCQTDRPAATSDEPTCQLLRQIWLMAQNEMNAYLVHVRREGGRGRISSLIQTEEVVSFVVGTARKSTMERQKGILVRVQNM